jgi:predicted DNA-binding transcriptional regulator AlpA
MSKKTKTIKLPVQTQTQTTRMKMKKRKDGSYEFADVKYSAWMTDRTYTTSEVADKLLVSRETLYVWLRGKQIPEPKQIRLGKKTQYLWTDSDIEAANERKLKGQSR